MLSDSLHGFANTLIVIIHLNAGNSLPLIDSALFELTPEAHFLTLCKREESLNEKNSHVLLIRHSTGNVTISLASGNLPQV